MGDFYLDRIRETFYELAGDMIFDPVEIRLSGIIDDAGVIGAATLPLVGAGPLNAHEI